MDWRLAWTRAFPLTVACLGLVYSGVYAGPSRDYIYLSYCVVIGLLVTLAYRPLKARLDERRNLSEQHCYSLALQWDSTLAQGELVAAETASLLGSGRLGNSSPRTQLLATQLERFQARLEQWRHYRPQEQDILERQLADMRFELTQMARNQEQVPQVDLLEKLCCLGCGNPCSPGRFCSFCGLALPQVVVCGCGDPVVVPVHLLDDRHPYHCHRCGESHK